MKTIIGICLIVLGIGLGLYVGAYLMFFCGIVSIIEQIQDGIVPMTLAIGIMRVVFATFVGGIAGYALIIPGMGMVGK